MILSEKEIAELEEKQLAVTTMYAEQIEEERRKELEDAKAQMAIRDEGLDPNIGDQLGEGNVLGDVPNNPNLSGDDQVQDTGQGP